MGMSSMTTWDESVRTDLLILHTCRSKNKAVWAVLFASGLIFWIVSALTVRAAPVLSVTPSGLIAAVNALRASQGLAPYKVDSGLMSYAQEHTEYMARMDQGTHRHSDGSMPSDRGVTENVASGSEGFLTTELIIYTIWADPVHGRTMTGYSSGSVGAGVASNGENTYVSLDVRPSGSTAGTSNSGGSGASGKQGSTAVALIAPVVTSTPRPDGSVVHVVGYGQSLWQIAITYGVHIDDIRILNGLPAGSTTIYEGQKLIIRPVGSVTPIATASPTRPTTTSSLIPEPAATRRSPTATHPVQKYTVTPTRTLIPAPTITPAPSFTSAISLDSRTVLVGAIFFAAAALFVVFLLSFRK